MRVLMSYHGLMDPDSGACGSMVKIGREMQARGVTVDFWTYSDLPKLGSTVSNHFRFPFRLAKRVGSEPRPDLLDACTGDSWVVGGSRHRGSVPVVVRSSGLEHQFLGPKRRPGESWKFTLYWRWFTLWTVGRALRRADHFVALTQGEADYAVQRIGMRREDVSVMAHIMPKHFYQPPPRSLPEEFSIAWVAIWDERKGRDELVKALDKVHAAGVPFRLTLAGTRFPETAILPSIPAAWRDRVTVIEKLPNSDLPKLYATHHVFAFPSRYEGFGKSLTEAMLCGCPPVCTHAGVAEGLVRDGVNGRLVGIEDPAGLAEALLWCARHPAETERLGMQARQDVQSVFSDSVYDERVALYERLIAGARSR
jgi:glycosyltransferase involved in cell wall biosynthesis